MKNPLVVQPGQLAPDPIANTEHLLRQDLSLTYYDPSLRGGPLGRMTEATVSHPVYGKCHFAWPMPMSEEAVLDWVALTIPAKLFKKQVMDASGRGVEPEKPVGSWGEDPLAGKTHEEKRAIIQTIKDRAAQLEKEKGHEPQT